MVVADAFRDSQRTGRAARAETQFSGLTIRALDIVFAAAAALLLLPFALGVALAIKAHDRGPILFGHLRVGKDGRLFRCWKFRSMVVDAEQRLADLLARDPVARSEWEADHKLRVDPRVTRLGDFLRKSSLDELPQLLNVLRGEMSMVGPRPVVSAEVSRYGRYFNDYCSVRPGITGLWQVMGRNDVSYKRRVALDVAYVRSQSISLYIKVLILTLPAVLSRSGVY
jgi:exopolysaccharide production protein ExoY